MPNQYDYESAATDFRAKAAAYRSTLAWVPPTPSALYVGPGPVADHIEMHFDGVLRSLHTAASELEQAARQCDYRAGVCADYRRAVDRYYNASPDERLAMGRPQRPASWADDR